MEKVDKLNLVLVESGGFDLGFVLTQVVLGLGGTQGPIIALPLSQVVGKDAGQVLHQAPQSEILLSTPQPTSLYLHPCLESAKTLKYSLLASPLCTPLCTPFGSIIACRG